MEHSQDSVKPPSIIHDSSCFRVRYRVAEPTQYLVKTGMGVNGMSISKKTVQLPFQTVAVIDMDPHNYRMAIESMSSEMVPFSLPVVFTIGPVDPMLDEEAFKKFATKLSGMAPKEMEKVIGGMIQGETRILSAQLTIREMFADRDKFRSGITGKVQKDMNEFGLRIYNANIAEMHDLDLENKYFENLKRKALEGANTEARIQVAEARKLGDIGEGQRMGDTKVETAKIDAGVKVRLEDANRQARIQCAEAKKLGDVGERQRTGDATIEMARVNANVAMQENARRQEIMRSNAQRDVVAAEARFTQEQAELQAAMKKAALETQLQQALAQQNVETMRATELSEKQIQAEAVRVQADAALYKMQKEAEGELAVAKARAEGLAAIVQAAGSQPDLARFCLGMESGLFERLAKESAAAIQGLQPKINIWNTGSDASGADPMAPIRNLFQSMPPMLDALAQQTDVKLPNFMPQVPPAAAT